MRSRRAVVWALGVLAVGAALAVAWVPTLLEQALARALRDHVRADLSFERLRPVGWTGIELERPVLSRGGSVLASAARLGIGFRVTETGWDIAAIEVDGLAFDLDRAVLDDMLVEREGVGGDWSLDLAVTRAHGRFEDVTVDNIEALVRFEGESGRTRVSLRSLRGTVLGESCEAEGEFVATGEGVEARGEVELAGLRAELAWNGALSVVIDRPSPERFARVWTLLADRIPALREPISGEWTPDRIERLDHLSFRTDLATRHEGMVRGLKVKGIDAELVGLRFAVAPGVLSLDSVSVVAVVRGETARIDIPTALLDGGAWTLPRLAATSSSYTVAGSKLRLRDGELRVEIDRFEARLKEATVTGRGTLAGPAVSPSFEGDIRLEGLRAPRVAADLDLRAAIGDLLGRPGGSLGLTGGRIRLAGYALRPAGGRIRLEDGILSIIEPVRLVAPGLEIALAGALGIGGDRVAALRRLAWSVGADDLDWPVSSGTGTETFQARRVVARGLGADSWAIEASEGKMPGIAFLEAWARSLDGPGLSAEAGVTDLRARTVHLEAGRIEIRNGAIVSAFEARGSAAGPSGARVPFAAVLKADTLELDLDGSTWRGPFRLRREGDRLRLTSDRIEGGGGHFILDGAFFGPEGNRVRASFDADLAGLIPASVREEAGLERVGGRVRGVLEWGPSAYLDAEIRDGILVLQRGILVSELGGKMSWHGEDAVATIRLTGIRGRTEGGQFEGEGTLWIAAADSIAIEARWRSEGFALAALAPFDTRLEGLEGRADADLTLRGSWQEPEIGGRIAFRDLGIELPGIGRLREGTADLVFNEGRAVLSNVEGRLGIGRFRAAGTVGYDDANLRVTLDSMPYRPRAGVEAVLSGALALTRPARGMWRLEGDLLAEEARVQIEEFTAPELGDGEPQEARLELNLAVRVASVRMTGRDLLLQGGGVLEVKGTDADPRVTGALECGAGRIVTRNATFRVRESRIVLPEHGEPTVTARAASRIDRVRIFADVSGSVADPRITLSSIPARSEAEIVTMLAVGREISGEGVVAGAVGIGAGGFALPLANAAGSTLGSGIGLESLRFEKSEGDTGSAVFDQVSIGGYVSDRVYVGYSKRTGEEAERRVEVEYEINPELFVKFEAGDRGTAGGGLEWRRDY